MIPFSVLILAGCAQDKETKTVELIDKPKTDLITQDNQVFDEKKGEVAVINKIKNYSPRGTSDYIYLNNLESKSEEGVQMKNTRSYLGEGYTLTTYENQIANITYEDEKAFYIIPIKAVENDDILKDVLEIIKNNEVEKEKVKLTDLLKGTSKDKIFEKPVKVGSKIETVKKTKDEGIKKEYEVKSINESINLPYGNMDNVLKIHHKETDVDSGSVEEYEIYFKENLGIVKHRDLSFGEENRKVELLSISKSEK